MNHLYQKAYWTIRPWLWRNPLFKTIDDWYQPEDPEDPNYVKQSDHYARFLRCWEFLRPFFLSRGFTLYDHGPQQYASYPSMTNFDPASLKVDNYPYGRRFYETREKGKFLLPMCMRLWAAQDSLGRDVIIKIVPECELKVVRYLNTPEARANPRNHTIPLIDSGTVGGVSFVVTPRWDGAYEYHFKTVAELLQSTKALLEGLDFLHENRVFHGDILDQNIGMNVSYYLTYLHNQPDGLREPSSTRYAYYDFETSLIYPRETPLDDIWETEYNGFELRGIPRPDGPFRVFPLDVLCLGLLLQERTKHIEALIPEIGPFLNSMINTNEHERYTARKALAEFEKIYVNIGQDVLSHRLNSYRWCPRSGIMYFDPDKI